MSLGRADSSTPKPPLARFIRVLMQRTGGVQIRAKPMGYSWGFDPRLNMSVGRLRIVCGGGGRCLSRSRWLSCQGSLRSWQSESAWIWSGTGSSIVSLSRLTDHPVPLVLPSVNGDACSHLRCHHRDDRHRKSRVVGEPGYKCATKGCSWRRGRRFATRPTRKARLCRPA